MWYHGEGLVVLGNGFLHYPVIMIDPLYQITHLLFPALVGHLVSSFYPDVHTHVRM